MRRVTHLNLLYMHPATLAAVALWFLIGTPAQALPLPVTALGTPAMPASTLTTLAVSGIGVAFPDSLGTLQPGFPGEARDPKLQVSFAIRPRDGGIVISVRRADPFDNHGPRIEERAGHALAGRAPLAQSTAVLLIGSGLVGAGITSGRRRGPRRFAANAISSHSRKKASGRAPGAPSRSSCGTSYSIPLRI